MDKKEVAFKIIEILENEKVRISDLNDIFGYVTSVVSTTAIAPTTKDIHFPGEIVKCTDEEAKILKDRIPLLAEWRGGHSLPSDKWWEELLNSRDRRLGR